MDRPQEKIDPAPRTVVRILACAAALAAWGVPSREARAQSPAPPVAASTAAAVSSSTGAPAKPWRDSAELHLTSTNGNSRATTFAASDAFGYDWRLVGLELKGGALRSRSQGVTTAEQYDGLEKVQRKVKDDIYAYERFEWFREPLAGVLDRYGSSAGAGDVLWTDAEDTLKGEAGGGYTSERRPDRINEFASGRAYAKYRRVLSATADFTQDLEYVYDFRQARDYRLTTETAIVAAIATHWSLKASYKWRRVGQPAPGFIKDDTTTSAALIVNY